MRDALAASSHAVTDVNVLLDGRPLDTVPVDEVSSPCTAALYTGQDVIEPTLTSALEHAGGHVERGRRVHGLEQDADGVVVLVGPAGDDDAPDEQLPCRYVVGADGTRSVTRQALGVQIDDELLEGRATRQIDARLPWRRPTDADQL